MLKQTLMSGGDIRVVLMDSISSVDESDADAVVVSASHGGLSSGEYAVRFPLRLVFFNDAGGGKDHAGSAALELLQNMNRAAATISHDSARIGDALDHWENGVVSAANASARAAGVKVLASVRDTLDELMTTTPAERPV